MKAHTSAVALVVSISAVVTAAQQPIQSGFGQGAYREGSGVTAPLVIKEVRPNYTSDAMRARIQGRVELEAVVLANGTVGDVRVVRSLDAQFGLDQEAMIAARKWLFRPGYLSGTPVPTVVSLTLEFRLHSGPLPQDPFAVALQPGETPSGRVSDPKLLREMRPIYTEAAMRAKIQGLVELEAVVEPDGTVQNVRVTKSLDKTFGLDQQAIAAAKQWQFEPGRLNGQAVPVLVTLILEFRLSRAPGSEQTPVPASDPFLQGVTKTGEPGAVAPKMLRNVRPNYTAAAMQAKIQGTVEIEAVVMPDGTVARARVSKSLDTIYSLDAEALLATFKTTFEPGSGTLNGAPVPFLVTIVQEFRLH